MLGRYGEGPTDPDNYVFVANDRQANFYSVSETFWNGMSPAERIAANLRFLDEIIAEGNVVYFVDEIDDVKAQLELVVEGNRRENFTLVEYRYLISRGYQEVPGNLHQLFPPG